MPGLDTERLADWLGWSELSATRLPGGRSNLTYRLTNMTTMDSLVLKRPPLGESARSAHSVTREHLVTSALWGSEIPVPRPVSACADTTVLGAPFALWEHVDGTTYDDAVELAAVGAPGVRAIVADLVDTLAVLHGIDPTAVGLAEFGRPEGFLNRQLRRWGSQLDDHGAALPPGIERLADDLTLAVPRSGPATIVHGDYRLGNTLVREDKVIAVLDWEMATVGDPLTDLGLLICHTSRTDTVLPNPATAAGHPSPTEMIERYARRTGRDVSGIAWYVAFAFFKLAVVCLGVAARHRAGRMPGPGFDGFDDLAVSATTQAIATLEEK